MPKRKSDPQPADPAEPAGKGGGTYRRRFGLKIMTLLFPADDHAYLFRFRDLARVKSLSAFARAAVLEAAKKELRRLGLDGDGKNPPPDT